MAIFNIIEEQEYDELDYMLDMCNEMMSVLESDRTNNTLTKMVMDDEKKYIKQAYISGQDNRAKYLTKNLKETRDKINNEIKRGYNTSSKDTEKYKHSRAKEAASGFETDSKLPNKFYRSLGEDKPGRRPDALAAKAPGSVLKKQEEKKKAIKETCLYILSVLDEM